ncbi:hypothetical protein ALC60_04865 [Trachymyrmex zeteki]|uniref:Uncharacterized protein n=1 Tax=Mycetomoellerius zeteki TaxID=64791 RepID=A0A151X7A1_9HYME|nr:hypothetical protein ALC60_04865 [Trachymyrmex zeteki]
MRKSQRMWDGSKPENRGSGKSAGLSSRRVMDRVSAEEDDIVKSMYRTERQSRCIDNWLSRNTIDESYRRRTEQPIEVEPNLEDPVSIQLSFNNILQQRSCIDLEYESGRSSVGTKQPSATFEGSREETLPAYLHHRFS